jgi:pseudouridine-5'-phosphate glycosidase
VTSNQLALRLRDDVSQALAEGRPVVALESAFLSHGLPFPVNRETALAAQNEARSLGVVPAMIAVLDGVVRVGLDEAEIERLASSQGVVKASCWDLGAVTALRQTAGTTVAATLAIAGRLGIRVLATGGIGGVHPGGRDVSADLWTLAHTPAAVVCSGPKAILDLPQTLEMLEGLGVPVVGYGTDELPAFFAASSGLALPWRVDDLDTAAQLMRSHWHWHSSSVLLVQPPPDDALSPEELREALEWAESQARLAGVRGRELTPFLLARIAERTQGRSGEVNRRLLVANAGLAARLASTLAVPEPE